MQRGVQLSEGCGCWDPGKDHRLLYHSTLGVRVIKKTKKKKDPGKAEGGATGQLHPETARKSGQERLVNYCQTTIVSAAHATHTGHTK